MTREVLRSKKPPLPNHLLDILQQPLLDRVPPVGRADDAYRVGKGSGRPGVGAQGGGIHRERR